MSNSTIRMPRHVVFDAAAATIHRIEKERRKILVEAAQEYCDSSFVFCPKFPFVRRPTIEEAIHILDSDKLDGKRSFRQSLEKFARRMHGHSRMKTAVALRDACATHQGDEFIDLSVDDYQVVFESNLEPQP